MTADVTLSSFSSFGRKQLLAFSAEPSGGKPATGKSAAATNALIAEALASNKAAPEKLSPDVEAAARRIGRGAGEKIVAYGKTQGWFAEADAKVAETVQPEVAKPAGPKVACGQTGAAEAGRRYRRQNPREKPAASKPADLEPDLTIRLRRIEPLFFPPDVAGRGRHPSVSEDGG